MLEKYLNQIILGVKSPRWSNEEKTSIDVEAKFCWSDDQYIPFTATQNDVMDYGKAIFLDCVEGKYGKIEDYIDNKNYPMIAKRDKKRILDNINNKTSAWKSQLLLDIITEKDKEQLLLWMRYAQLIDSISTDVEGFIDWPTPP